MQQKINITICLISLLFTVFNRTVKLQCSINQVFIEMQGCARSCYFAVVSPVNICYFHVIWKMLFYIKRRKYKKLLYFSTPDAFYQFTIGKNLKE